MDEMMGPLSAPTQRWFPAVDVIEEENKVKFIADLPGLNEKDVTVEIQDDVLSIRGIRSTAKEERTDNYIVCERSSGTFERRFRLDAGVKQKDIKADFENGVLTVTVPKVVTAEPKKILIKSH
jgi:HSP20 family protein